MYCTSCGTELSTNAKFCSSCGQALSERAAVPSKVRDWDLHVSILAWLTIAQAAMTGVIGLIVMFGGQVARKIILENPHLFDNADADIPPPEVIASIIVPATFLIGVLLILFAMPSIAAGIGLLRYRSWGRVLAIIVAVLRVLEFPLGTLTAIYSFWVLLSRGGKAFFQERAERAEV